MEIDGFELFQAAMQISPNIAYYLPKNTSETQIGELAMLNSGVVEIEANFLNDRIKALTAYFGALAGSDFTLEEGYEGECEPDPGSGPRRSRRKKRKLSHIL